jgi:hypothetical protein
MNSSIRGVPGTPTESPLCQALKKPIEFVVIDHECPAAETAGLRLDQAEHRLHSDHRIDRRAPVLQDRRAGGRRQRIRRHHHFPLRGNGLRQVLGPCRG